MRGLCLTVVLGVAMLLIGCGQSKPTPDKQPAKQSAEKAPSQAAKTPSEPTQSPSKEASKVAVVEDAKPTTAKTEQKKAAPKKKSKPKLVTSHTNKELKKVKKKDINVKDVFKMGGQMGNSPDAKDFLNTK